MFADEMLSRTVRQLAPSPAGVYAGDADRVERTAKQLGETAEELWSMAGKLGITGDSAEIGADRFREVAREIQERADQCKAAADVARQAHRDLTLAREDYEALPPGEIDAGQRTALMSGSTIIVGGRPYTGPAAVGYLDHQAALAREIEAQKILNRLNSCMAVATSHLPEVHVPENLDPDPIRPSPTLDGGGGVSTFNPGGTGTGSTGATGPGTGTTQSAWAPPPEVSTDPTNPQGSYAAPGGTNAAATMPGGGSADGSVGGTVPGSNTGPGSIGAGTGTGIGSGTGVGGAGVLAGGTAIGGAALGAAGLGRTGLGAPGAGGIGGAGRIGGIGGAGGMNAGGIGGHGGAGGPGGLAAGVRGATGIGVAPTGSSTTGAGTGAGAGGRGMTGMPMGGGGAASAGSTKKRTGSAGYLVPDLGIDDDPTPTPTPMGPGARAGSRDQLPPVIDEMPDDLDEETW